MSKLALLGALTLTIVGVSALGMTGTARAVTCVSPSAGHVAVVVDFGAAPGAPDGLLARCVTVAPGSSGKAALQGATGPVGRDASGKVCQIAGFPTTYDPTNCSAPHDGTIAYWSYFRGTTAGWSYSPLGDAATRVRPEVVEGWRFVEIPAGATQTREPPRNFSNGASYLWQSTCPAAPPATVPPATRAPVTNAPDTRVPVTSASGGTDPPASVVPPPDAQSPSAATSTTRRAASTTSDPTTTSAGSVGAAGLRSAQRAPRLTRTQVAAAARDTPNDSSPTGAIVAGAVSGVGLASVLAVLTVRSRRRRSGPGV